MKDEPLHHAEEHPGRVVELVLSMLEQRFRGHATGREMRRSIGTLACWLTHFAPHASRFAARAILAHFNREQN